MTTHCNLPVGIAKIYLVSIFHVIWYARHGGGTLESLLRPNPSSKGVPTWEAILKLQLNFTCHL